MADGRVPNAKCIPSVQLANSDCDGRDRIFWRQCWSRIDRAQWACERYASSSASSQCSIDHGVPDVVARKRRDRVIDGVKVDQVHVNQGIVFEIHIGASFSLMPVVKTSTSAAKPPSMTRCVGQLVVKERSMIPSSSSTKMTAWSLAGLDWR